MAETMIERQPLMEDMGLDNEDVEAGLEIRPRKKGIVGKTNVEKEENEGHLVYFDQDKDVDSAKENKDPNNISVEENNNLSNTLTENGSETNDIVEKKKEIEIQKAHKQVVDYDVERVIAEQETHDLFCPNCHSCITERVILRKRKRIPRPTSPDRPEKIQHVPEAHPAPTETDNIIVQQEEDLIRCLSCFSFFIPTDGGFNIFRIFGKNEENINLSRSGAAPGKKVNCISFLFGSESSNNKESEAGNDNVPTESTARQPGIEDGNILKLPISTHVPSDDDNLREPLLAKGPTEINPSIQIPETHAVGDTVLDIGVPEVPAPIRCEWEILKSIVYGGLIESITSLSVVSSAAGSGSSTLNICALGLANLVSGLFLVSNDLSELKRSMNNTETTDQTQSQYFKKLGKRENFKRHVFFSILSFIIFGLIPPVVYGFAFRESDNKENKIIAAAGSSLLCVAILALGKAHVRPGKGYFKSLFYYIGLALPASGLSYVAGVMIERLFEGFHLFDQRTHIDPSVSLVKSVVKSFV